MLENMLFLKPGSLKEGCLIIKETCLTKTIASAGQNVV